jgi:hypothetical protein
MADGCAHPTARAIHQHASWLNPAEIEVGLWSRECLGRDRVATFG